MLDIPKACLIATAVGYFVSFGLLVDSWRKEGVLGKDVPQAYEACDEIERDGCEFDAGNEEGFPVDMDGFWSKVKWRMTTVASLLGTALAAKCLWFLQTFAGAKIRAYAPGVDLLFSMYLLVLVISPQLKESLSTHRRSTLHLCTLIALTVTTRVIPLTALTPTFESARYQEIYINTFEMSAPVCFELGIHLLALLFALTTPLAPQYTLPLEAVYPASVTRDVDGSAEASVCDVNGCSIFGFLFFSWTTQVVMSGRVPSGLNIRDLPILPAKMRAKFNYVSMKQAIEWSLSSTSSNKVSRWKLAAQLLKLNSSAALALLLLGVVVVLVSYAPAILFNKFIQYLEENPSREDKRQGQLYVLGLFLSSAVESLMKDHLYSISTVTLEVRLRMQLNSVLFKKTLCCKAASTSEEQRPNKDTGPGPARNTKAQIMTLMTTDVDRLSKFLWHLYLLFASPFELALASFILYRLLGVSCFIGIGVSCVLLPLNHFVGKSALATQGNLLRARDERVTLMNEVLSGIRMLKYMAWERKFEERILKIRERELQFQKANYSIETFWRVIWYSAPVIVSVFTFWHFSVVRQQHLAPSIAFTAILVFGKMKYALNGLPGAFVGLLEAFVSLRRIAAYLNQEETQLREDRCQPMTIGFQNCTLTWSRDHSTADVSSLLNQNQPGFALKEMNLVFPPGELSLICGKLGSGKTLLLLGLLGEVEVLSGKVHCPRSPPTVLSNLEAYISPQEWILEGVCAYVPQVPWLLNATIKDNILFHLPYDEDRYMRTIEVCGLMMDLEILEDGDYTEIGERGVNLSGGQKARISLARAVYSRASILLLDDIFSAVDAHTASHLLLRCLRGDLVLGRTVVLASHHVRLCGAEAKYIVALKNGRVQFQGNYAEFRESKAMFDLVEGISACPSQETQAPAVLSGMLHTNTSTKSSSAPSFISGTTRVQANPRKLVEESRTTGHIGKDVWQAYMSACGGNFYWLILVIALLAASLSPVLENGWLKRWSSNDSQVQQNDSKFYLMVYSALTAGGLVVSTIRWFFLYSGTIRASDTLYKRLLRAVLLANMRFHDTVSRGRVMNRFGKDFEDIDSTLPDDVAHAIMYGLSALTTVITISFVGGLPFVVAIVALSVLYFKVAKIYGYIARDMRRLCSITRSPLYSMYGETIAGVTVIRAFGASSRLLQDMLQRIDMQSTPYYWMWAVNRWLGRRFNFFSDLILGIVALVSLLTPTISASLAGFALTFASTITTDMLFLAWRFVGLEQAMVAVERVKEYSDLPEEGSQHTGCILPAHWPANGNVEFTNLTIRYASDLPDVLHKLNFNIKAGEKIGIVGRTGSGKSTLALSLFRFVEPVEGVISIDGVDITQVGLNDLRSRLTIIPQDPTILSGTLRSTLDVFDEYEDCEIYEALRRVHLISSDAEDPTPESISNVFQNLDSSVSHGGENFSTGQKQLLCMARAILKRTKILIMDEATASVDYATDELISTTIRGEFAGSTILTIAHRLRTIIDYDRVMVLDQGKIVEFDRPAMLLRDAGSRFYSMCQATGEQEFWDLKRIAEASGH